MLKKYFCAMGLILSFIIFFDIFENNTHKPDLVLDAVLSGNITATKFLLERSHYVNKKYEYGHTLLHCAALSGNYEMVKLLVEHHALILENDFGLTAIDSARDMGNERIVTYLKQYYKL